MAITPGADIEAEDFIDTSAGAADEGNVPKLDEHGILNSSFIPFLPFGDGSDGDVTISSPTTLTRDMYYDNLTVNSTLTTNGFKIHVADTLSGTGTIKYPTPSSGGNGSGTTQGSGAAAFSGAAFGVLVNVPGSNGGVGGTAPNNNGAGVAAANRLIGDANNAGGSGPTGSFAGTTNGNGGAGGGGGASGGLILIFARTWAGSFTIEAVGGDGGNGGNAAGGSGTGTDSSPGKAGGDGGNDVSIAKLGAYLLLDMHLWHFNQDGTLSVRKPAGAGGGGGGAFGRQATGGGGGCGGHGGFAFVFFQTKTWTGTGVFTGGDGGNGGNGSNGGGNGGPGDTGAEGALIEVSTTDNFVTV